jgi:2-succinyl-5-enolpyruvyl-6-hydroxy-3-cyclohexene-1-carboxylate synthase
MYTDDKNAQIILSLLKQHGIKKIVISPGSTNVPISRSVQLDPWFEAYSVVDERSAAYFAVGLAHSTGEPVVISCTGATASRNYLPGLTEAYYRNLPVIALTSQHHTSDFGNLVPQVTDRTVSQNDVKKISVSLPVVKDEEDYEHCVIAANKALIAATTRGGGPVHINLHIVGDYSFTTPELPKVRKISYYNNAKLDDTIEALNLELKGKKIGVFVGAHRKIDGDLKRTLENFAIKYNAPVFIDQTSGYNGKNSVLISHIADLKWSPNKPDIVIDMGSITGDYSISWLFGIETWRLSEDGEVHDRLHNQTKLFDGLERNFFEAFEDQLPLEYVDYFSEIENETASVSVPYDEMPLSNTYISYTLSKLLPKNSSLHLGILNSLRNMNFFKLHSSIDASSNVGGFGIDGALSTLIGQSVASKNRLYFGLVGDLAAFYDMNALGIRHIGNNVRILMVNNDGGVEFRLDSRLETKWADATNEFISAGGHNGTMKGWAESRGFHYISANTKQDFDKKIKNFCTPSIDEFKGPVFFEVFTNISDEQKAVSAIQEANRPRYDASPNIDIEHDPSVIGFNAKSKVKQNIKRMTPVSVRKVYRKLKKRD